MSDFLNQLKQSQAMDLGSLTKQMEDLGKKKYSDDDADYWYPKVDKAGNALAIVRFIPAPIGEPSSIIRIFSYSFKGPGGWYIENSRATLNGQPDPVDELWSQWYNEDKNKAKLLSRRQNFVANIHVQKEQNTPENNNTEHLYRFGKKIFDKLQAKMAPAFEGDEKQNPFDVFTGMPLRMKVKTVTESSSGETKKWPNYDESEWGSPCPLAESPEEIERICKNAKSLQALIAPDRFKSYEELKDKLYKVLALAQTTSVSMSGLQVPKANPATQPSAAPKASSTPPWESDDADGEEEESNERLDFLKKLAED